MNERELISRLEKNITMLYKSIRQVKDEENGLALSRSLKVHQRAYKRITGRYYLPPIGEDGRN